MKRHLARLWLPFREALAVVSSLEGRQYAWGTPFYANSVYLMANSAVAAALGFVFWIIVARFYAVEAVGLGSALVSVAALLVFVANLGLGVGLIRFLPGAGAGASALVNSCLTLAGLAALALAALFVVGIPLWSPTLGFVRQDPIFIAAFIAFVVAATIFSLFERSFRRPAPGRVHPGPEALAVAPQVGHRCLPDWCVQALRHVCSLGATGGPGRGAGPLPHPIPSFPGLPPHPHLAEAGEQLTPRLTVYPRIGLGL